MTIMKHIFSMAMVSLIVLVIQNSLLVVMTRFSRKNVEATLNYHTSTLVLNQECVKMLMCLIIYAFDDVWKQFYGDIATANGSAGCGGTHVVTEEVRVEMPKDNEDASSAALLLRGSQEKPFANHENGRTTPAREQEGTSGSGTAPIAELRSGAAGEHGVAVVVPEGDASGMAAGFVPTMRRGVRVPVPSSSAAVASSFSFPSPSSTLADAGYSRRGELRFAWMRVQAAVHLYCSMLRVAIFKRDTLKLLVPAFLFNLQNFLIFVGLSNLDAVSFQVWSQTKLLSTALFSVWLLHRKLSPMQWCSLVALTAGVLGAQVGTPRGGSAAIALAAATTTTTSPTRSPRLFRGALTMQQQVTRAVRALAGDAVAAGLDGDEEPQANALIGIAACVLSGLSSSYAGVYFEKVVKTTSPTLSIRNIQLSLFGIPFAFVSMLLLDVVPHWYEEYQCGDPVHWNIFSNPFTPGGDVFGVDGACPARPFYFWQRYDQLLTWGLVGIHAFGGLLVAIVVKYADNILKGFATGVAVIVSGMMSSVIWGYKPSVAFVLGAVLVIGSSIAFHKFEPKR